MTPPDILLVEDNPNDAELALYALRKHNISKSVDVVRDGAEALEYVFATGSYANRQVSETPRVIFLDLKLPKINGLEVLHRIKSDPRTQTVPVVILTSSREESDILKSYQLGVNSYIVKPIDFEQFTEALRQLGVYWLFHNQLPR
ncbi:MAG: response regulator [Chloroflexota bacterium]